jgi:hypothetical protein
MSMYMHPYIHAYIHPYIHTAARVSRSRRSCGAVSARRRARRARRVRAAKHVQRLLCMLLLRQLRYGHSQSAKRRELRRLLRQYLYFCTSKASKLSTAPGGANSSFTSGGLSQLPPPTAAVSFRFRECSSRCAAGDDEELCKLRRVLPVHCRSRSRSRDAAAVLKFPLRASEELVCGLSYELSSSLRSHTLVAFGLLH